MYLFSFVKSFWKTNIKNSRSGKKQVDDSKVLKCNIQGLTINKKMIAEDIFS